MTSIGPAGAELLVVAVGGHRYGMPVECVREVLFAEVDMNDARWTWRGVPAPVLDLARELGGDRSARGERLVVIERAGAPCALRVDAVEGVRSVPVQLSAALSEPSLPPSALLAAVALDDGVAIGVLDVEALFALAAPGGGARVSGDGGGEETRQTELLAMGSRGRSWALPLESVEGIAELTSMATVPQVPEFVRGVVSFRGEILLAVDLAQLLDPRARGFGDLRHVVAISAGGRRMALLVERTLDVFVAPLQSFLPGAHAALPRPSDAAEGATTFLEAGPLIAHVFAQLEGGR